MRTSLIAWRLALSLVSLMQVAWSGALPPTARTVGSQSARVPIRERVGLGLPLRPASRLLGRNALAHPLPGMSFVEQPAVKAVGFTLPEQNACHSAYDRFYSTELGVYAFWPLCESTSLPVFYDIVGRYDWNVARGAWFSGAGDFTKVQSGPVQDNEGAVQTETASSFYAAQNLVLNGRAGTVAVWANTSADQYVNSMLAFEAVGGRSKVWVAASSHGEGVCFEGQITNAGGTTSTTSAACGYGPNTWHRVSLTWLRGQLSLYVDGMVVGTRTYAGALDNSVFVYRLFPQGVHNGEQMTLAKATLANQAWNAAQVHEDFIAAVPRAPEGGVLVTNQALGTVHRDVLGVVDNESLLSADAAGALKHGLATAGVTAVRYANGKSGIQADLENWQTPGLGCGAVRRSPELARQAAGADITDRYMAAIAQGLGLSLGYTVNYGTNPPFCNAGGDPEINGADLVRYLNRTKGYGFKYFEIGNELYNGGGSETDLHSQPGKGASYAGYEAVFAQAMKSVDPTIRIGIPIGLDHVFSWLNDWTLPAMANANYDAVIYHDYPTLDPVTDGATLYPERVASGQGSSRGDLLTLQTLLLNAGKNPESIWVTEWNDNGNGGGRWSRQALGAASPLFAAMSLGEYMDAGVQWATWFAQYGQTNDCNPFNYDPQGETAYSAVDRCSGSFLVYTGAIAGEQQVGFRAGDLSPVGHVFSLLSQSSFATEGEHMVRTVPDETKAPWLLSYAATHGSGYAVMLINRDPNAAHEVPVQFAGKASGTSVQRWTYGRAQYDTAFQGVWSTGPVHTSSGAWSARFAASLPPWSISVFVF